MISSFLRQLIVFGSAFVTAITSTNAIVMQTKNERAVSLSAEGILKKRVEAFALFEQAAGEGDLAAETNLGLSYLLGLGVPSDPIEGGRILRAVAEKGDAFAALTVATTLAGGNGNLFAHDSEKACDALVALFNGPAAPEAQFRFSELCSSSVKYLNNLKPLNAACVSAAEAGHRVAKFNCNSKSIPTASAFRAKIDFSLAKAAWYSGTIYEKQYITRVFSDRNEYLAYSILLLEFIAKHNNFDVRHYLRERGIALINW